MSTVILPQSEVWFSTGIPKDSLHHFFLCWLFLLLFPFPPSASSWLLYPPSSSCLSSCVTVFFLRKDWKWSRQCVMHDNLQPAYKKKKKEKKKKHLRWLMVDFEQKKLTEAVMNLSRTVIFYRKVFIRWERWLLHCCYLLKAAFISHK